MKFTGDYLYRVRVTAYPPGSHQDIDCGGETHTVPVEGWQPPGWRPRGNYTQMLGTTEFVWPVTTAVYGSRSTAKKRADLLQSYGAATVIERSSRITWPDEETHA